MSIYSNKVSKIPSLTIFFRGDRFVVVNRKAHLFCLTYGMFNMFSILVDPSATYVATFQRANSRFHRVFSQPIVRRDLIFWAYLLTSLYMIWPSFLLNVGPRVFTTAKWTSHSINVKVISQPFNARLTSSHKVQKDGISLHIYAKQI